MKIDTLYDQGSGVVNEDAFIVADPVFGVFDGMSSLEPYHNEAGQTGAAIASHLARDTFAKKDGAGLINTANAANQAIQAAMTAAGIDDSRKTARWSTTAAVIQLHNDRFEWVQIGDSLIIVIMQDGSFRLLVDDYDHDHDTSVQWQALTRTSTPNIRQRLDKQIRLVRDQMNVTYGALDGDPAMEQFLNHGTVSLMGVAHLLLFTDGLFMPKTDVDTPDDFAMFVQLFLSGGLQRVFRHVRALQASDPQCRRYIRFKPHDDIAAVALSFTSQA